MPIFRRSSFILLRVAQAWDGNESFDIPTQNPKQRIQMETVAKLQECSVIPGSAFIALAVQFMGAANMMSV